MPSIVWFVADVVDIRGKTEQRCAAVIEVLKNALEPLSYDDLRLATGGKKRANGTIDGGISYDILLYVVTAFVEAGLVEKTRLHTRKPGSPRVLFQWVSKPEARAMGARSAKAA